MSIEKDLTRIADALEGILSKLDHVGQAVDATVPQAPEAPKQPAAVPPPPVSAAASSSTPVTTAPAAVPPPPVEAQQVTPAPTTPPPVSTPAAPPVTTPPPVATMTPEQLNVALVAEFNRLGSREPIDTVMRAEPFNAQSIHDLAPEQYAALIDAVKAVSAS